VAGALARSTTGVSRPKDPSLHTPACLLGGWPPSDHCLCLSLQVKAKHSSYTKLLTKFNKLVNKCEIAKVSW